MEMSGKPDPRQAEILPLVRYAATRKAAKKVDRPAPIAYPRFESAVGNLQYIRKARETRGEDCAWIERIENSLLERARSLEGDKTLS